MRAYNESHSERSAQIHRYCFSFPISFLLKESNRAKDPGIALVSLHFCQFEISARRKANGPEAASSSDSLIPKDSFIATVKRWPRVDRKFRLSEGSRGGVASRRSRRRAESRVRGG